MSLKCPSPSLFSVVFIIAVTIFSGWIIFLKPFVNNSIDSFGNCFINK